MSSCDVCSKSFKRRDNMLRHKRNTHIEDEQDDRGDISSDSDENMDDDSEVDTDNSDDSAGSESDDVWDSLIKIELCELQSAYEEKVKDVMKLKSIRESRARSDVYEEMRPLYRRAIIKRFVARLLWFDSIRRDGVYKAIRASAERLRTEEDYGRQEALQYATNKRKYLFDKLLSDYGPPEIEADGEDDDNDDTESD